MLSQISFNKILSGNGIKNLSLETKQELYQIFNERGYDFKTANAIVNGIRRKAILSAEENGIVKINLLDIIKNHCSKIDEIKYKQLDLIVQKFKSYYKEKKLPTPKIENIIKQVYVAIKEHDDESNKNLANITSQNIEQLYIMACVYDTITRYVDDENYKDRGTDVIIGEKLVGTIINNKEFEINNELKERVEGLLQELTTNKNLPQEEAFSGAELKALLTHTTSIINYSDAIKANEARVVLRAYIETLKKEVVQGSEEDVILNKMTAKRILLKAGSALTGPEELKESISFIRGGCVRDVVEIKGKKAKDRTVLLNLFPDLSINGFTTRKQVTLLRKNPSLYSVISAPQVLDMNMQIINAIALSDGELDGASTFEQRISKAKMLGYDVDTLLNADNIVELANLRALKTRTSQENMAQNINYLSKILKPSDIQKIINHNIMFLCQSSERIPQTITEIAKMNKSNPQKLKEELEGYVNRAFQAKSGKKDGSGIDEKSDVEGGFKLEALPDLNSDKEYITLDLSFLLSQKEVDLNKNRPMEKLRITKENYGVLLADELTQLSNYLNSKAHGYSVSIKPETLAGSIEKLEGGEYSSEIKGRIKNQLKNLNRMLELLKTDTKEKQNVFNSAVVEIKKGIELRNFVLNLNIAESEAFGDELFLSNVTRNKQSEEKLFEYEKELEDLQQKLKKISSPKLKERHTETKALIELRIEEIKKDMETIRENKHLMKVAYDERLNAKYECDALLAIDAVFGEIKDECEEIKFIEIDTTTGEEIVDAKQREILLLKELLEKKTKKFFAVYKTPVSRKSSHAQKWYKHIEELDEKIKSMEKELSETQR